MSDFPRSPQPSRYRPVLWACLLLLLIGGALLLRHLLSAPVPVPVVEAPRPLRTVTLYFAAPDGAGLVAESREIVDCPRPEECLSTIIETLLAGPAGKLAPILPPQATLRGVSVVGSEVQADFSQSLVDSHPGGSLGELLTVYGLADTLAVNFPQLRQVRILIEGRAVETLKGHVDLSQPLTPDFSLIINAPAEQSTGVIPGRSL